MPHYELQYTAGPSSFHAVVSTVPLIIYKHIVYTNVLSPHTHTEDVVIVSVGQMALIARWPRHVHAFICKRLSIEITVPPPPSNVLNTPTDHSALHSGVLGYETLDFRRLLLTE